MARGKYRQNKRQASKVAGYASNFELEVATVLQELGIPYKYEERSFQWFERMPNYKCILCDSNEVQADRTYTPDFFILSPEGEVRYIIEVKGIFTVKDRKIADAMRDQHPDVKMRYLFYYNNKLNKNSKTRYTDWCDKRELQHGLRHTMRKTLRDWHEDDVS